MQSCRIYWKRIRVWILVFARNFIVVLNFKRKKHTKIRKMIFWELSFFCKTVFKIIKLLKIVFHFILLVCTIQSKFNKNHESLPTIEITYWILGTCTVYSPLCPLPLWDFKTNFVFMIYLKLRYKNLLLFVNFLLINEINRS